MTKKDVNFFSAQLRFWTRIFDYQGVSSQKEYWFPFILNVVLGALAGINIIMSGLILAFSDLLDTPVLVNIIHYFFLVGGIIIVIYLALSIIPWISLTVRRLRDGGKSSWWALLLLVVGIGHIFLFVICASASGVAGVFIPGENHPENIYGPPEMFDPDYNLNDGVYGPPDFDLENDNEFDPSENEIPVIYGPAPFDEEDYEPIENLNEDVYGPPEWYD